MHYVNVSMSTWLSVQYLRAIAALAVVWYHSCLEWNKIADYAAPGWFDGRSGVDLFFVISGFIIWVTTHDAGQSPLRFWYRRVIRILPLYWLCTAGMVALLIMMPAVFDRPHLDVGHVVQSLLFIPHADPFRPHQTYPLLQVGWTLNYEMFFYALFGCCLLLRAQHRVMAVILLLGGLVTLGVMLPSEQPIWMVYTNPLLLEFMAGVVIGYIFTSSWRPDAAFGYGMVLLSVFAYAGLNHELLVDTSAARSLSFGVPAALLITGLTTIERASGMPGISWLHRLGDASYAIYLSHVFVLGGLRWIWGRSSSLIDLPPSAFITAAMLTSLAVGLLLHVVFERPLVRFLQRLWQRSTSRHDHTAPDPLHWRRVGMA